MASRLSHSPQHKRAALTSVLLALSQQRAYTPAYQLGALIDVGGRQPLTTPSAVCLHNPLLHGLLLINRPRMDGRLSWPC